MIEFKIESTKYKVETPEKQSLVKAYCSKITKRTGRTTHKLDSFTKRHSSNPVYPCFIEGTSTAFYVRKYERSNAYRFRGNYAEKRGDLSLFDALSTNPQYTQDDLHIEEPNND